MEKRSLESMKNAREALYNLLNGEHFSNLLETIGYEGIGMGDKGYIVWDREEDSYVVISAVAKKETYDAEDDLQARLDKEEQARKKNAEKLRKQDEREKRKKINEEKESAEGDAEPEEGEVEAPNGMDQ